MKPENAAEFLQLVTALSEGKTIEFNHGNEKHPGWVELVGEIEFCGHPSLYRVKIPLTPVSPSPEI